MNIKSITTTFPSLDHINPFTAATPFFIVSSGLEPLLNIKFLTALVLLLLATAVANTLVIIRQEDELEPNVEPGVPPSRATLNPSFVDFEGEGCGNRNDPNITARPVVDFASDNEVAVILIPRLQAFLTTTSEQNREKFCNVRLRINFPYGFCTNITDAARPNGNIRLGSGVIGAVERAYGNVRQSITNTTVGPVSSRAYFFANSFTIARNPSDAVNNFVDFEYRARLRLSKNSNSATGELDNRLTVISILNQAPCNM